MDRTINQSVDREQEMYMPFKQIIGLVLGCFFLTNVQSAIKYVDATALKSASRISVGKVVSGTTVVPMITWGGDIRTIFANGMTPTTKRDSIFGQMGLDLRLVREDVFSTQLANYRSGKTPYLRGTLGMINMAVKYLKDDPRIQPIVIYQLTESAGGDALVVKSGIKTVKDLLNRTIAVQADGPHIAYLAKVLSDAGLSFRDVKIRWLPDLTGTDNTPMAAFYEDDVDAAMTIIPDALALTSGGNVGTGSEQSVKGATIMMSTKTANRVIADVYAVRSDYLQNQPQQVRKFVRGLMKAQEMTADLVASKGTRVQDYRKLMRAAGKLLLDAEEAVTDVEGLYADAEHMTFSNNVKFFTDRHYPRNFDRRNSQIQKYLSVINLTGGKDRLAWANWDFVSLKPESANSTVVEAPRFDQRRAATLVAKKQQQGTLDEGELFSFEVYFKPNQKTFSLDLYQDAFERVIDLSATYGGALITIEGHSDPHGYSKKKAKGASAVVLKRMRQSAKNLSVSRALSVRDAVINMAQSKHITLDPSQFALVGHGMESPKTGICGDDPCPVKTQQEWQDNMRVVFRIIQVEAEAEVFSPL
jgi:outer membrane protein OmpA-like peptidoglycan-associated protein